FDFSLEAVDQAIKNAFGKMPGYRYMKLKVFNENDLKSYLANNKLTEKPRQDDFYLTYSGSIGKSEIYFDKKNKPLDYYAEFVIHLIPTDSQNVRVKIITVNSKVAVGRKLLPSFPHFVRMIKTKDVEPSTIEEYEILLKIGEALGVSESMPKIERPN
ncbi:MAG: hypothetical protein ACKO96_24435, partial [Flammeovirgaceae bacterium]